MLKNNCAREKYFRFLYCTFMILLFSIFSFPVSASSKTPEKEFEEEFMEGFYAFQNAETGNYLADIDGTLTFTPSYDENTCLWYVKEFHRDYKDPAQDRVSYRIYPNGSDEMLDISNAWMTENNPVQTVGNTGHIVQYWKIQLYDTHTAAIVSMDDSSGYEFVLSENNTSPVIQTRRDQANQKWIVENHTEEIIKTVCSDDNSIIIEIPADKWSQSYEKNFRIMANKMAQAYDALVELHSGKRIYDKLIFDGFSDKWGGAYAYVCGNEDNHIYFCKSYLFDEVNVSGNEDKIFGFGGMHEMGHLYDFYEPWDFDTEVLTDFRILYILEKLDVSSSPYGRDRLCNYKTLPNLYRTNDGNKFENGYSIFYTDYMLSKIRDAVGWDVVIQALDYMDKNKTEAQISADKLAQLDYFMDTLSKFAGQDVTQFVDSDDYAALRGFLTTK